MLQPVVVAIARYFASVGVAAKRDRSITREWLRELISPPPSRTRAPVNSRFRAERAEHARRRPFNRRAVRRRLRPARARRVHFQTFLYLLPLHPGVKSRSRGVKSRWRKLRTHAKLILRGFVDPATARRLFSRYRAPFPLSHARNVTHARHVYYENTWRDCRLSRIDDQFWMRITWRITKAYPYLTPGTLIRTEYYWNNEIYENVLNKKFIISTLL